MLISLFSAKGSPGVTSAALVIASIWPREVALVEADRSGSDVALRCRAETGGSLTPSPNILGLTTAARSDRNTEIASWGQRLANGIVVVPGITSPAQANGLTTLWRGVAAACKHHPHDVIVDLGRIDPNATDIPFLSLADVIVPVLSASFESLVHTREVLKNITTHTQATVAPTVVGPSRSGVADAHDIDEVLAAAGVIAQPTTHLPLDHQGLRSLEQGTSLKGRGRMSVLLRAANPIADRLTSFSRDEVRT